MNGYIRSKKLVATVILFAVCRAVTAAPALNNAATTTRAQAITIVRGILSSNAASCRIDRVQSISAVRAGAVWKVTARLIMSASGRPLNETAVWNVRVSDGGAASANQLASEIENGCPLD